jgi:hypothetical protein
LSDADLDDLGGRSRWNITHVDVPRESDGPGRYDAAAATLREWIDAGVMVLRRRADVHDLPDALHRLRPAPLATSPA